MTVFLLSSIALLFLFRSLPLSFFFGSDVAKPLYHSREKPVAGLYWTDYHAPSVGAIRDARACIQGPVTCPAGVLGEAVGRDGGCRTRDWWGGEGREGEMGHKGVQRWATGGWGGTQQGSSPSFPPSTAWGPQRWGMGEIKGLPWEVDGRLKAPEEDAGVGVWGAKLRREGVLVILKSETCPFIPLLSFSALNHRCLHIFDVFKRGSYAAVDRFWRHADAEADLFPHIPLQQMAEEDTKHTKGGLDLLT